MFGEIFTTNVSKNNQSIWLKFSPNDFVWFPAWQATLCDVANRSQTRDVATDVGSTYGQRRTQVAFWLAQIHESATWVQHCAHVEHWRLTINESATNLQRRTYGDYGTSLQPSYRPTFHVSIHVIYEVSKSLYVSISYIKGVNYRLFQQLDRCHPQTWREAAYIALYFYISNCHYDMHVLISRLNQSQSRFYTHAILASIDQLTSYTIHLVLRLQTMTIYSLYELSLFMVRIRRFIAGAYWDIAPTVGVAYNIASNYSGLEAR